jgi:hypothetical protein
MTERLSNYSSRDNKPFYAHDFSLLEVVGQYDSFFNLGLTDQEKKDLIQDLFGPPAPASNLAYKSQQRARISSTPDGWS